MATSAQNKTSKKKASKKSKTYITHKNVMTYSLLIKQKTDNYLRSIDPNDFDPQDITIGLLDDTCDAIRKYNKKHDTHWTIPNDLLPYQIASIIANLHHAALIVLNSANIGSDHAILEIGRASCRERV